MLVLLLLLSEVFRLLETLLLLLFTDLLLLETLLDKFHLKLLLFLVGHFLLELFFYLHEDALALSCAFDATLLHSLEDILELLSELDEVLAYLSLSTEVDRAISPFVVDAGADKSLAIALVDEYLKIGRCAGVELEHTFELVDSHALIEGLALL